MNKFDLENELGSFALTSIIDHSLRKTRQYKDDSQNKLVSKAGGAFLGAVGWALGGPLLGVPLAALGHCIGQSVEWEEDDSDREHNNNSYESADLDVDNFTKPYFDYDKF